MDRPHATSAIKNRQAPVGFFLFLLSALQASHGTDSPKGFKSVRLKHLVFEVLLFSFSLTALSFIDLKVVHLRSLASPRTDGFKPSYLSG